MSYRTLALLPAFLSATLAVGCAGMPHNADLAGFAAAQKLQLDDCGSGGDRTSPKRSVTVSDAQTIAEVNGLLRSVAADWKPVFYTPASPPLTLCSIKDGKVVDVIWLGAPAGKDGEGFIQMHLPNAGMCSRDLSAKDFRRLLEILGVPEWQKPSASQHEAGG